MATTNPYRIPLKQFIAESGDYDTVAEFMEDNVDMLLDSVQPALCTEGCEVEPDGRCSHNCPSISIALGIIFHALHRPAGR